ncbi:transmembrane emp24 domain-containing protein 10-like, partial [Heptranchias perlo]|uniref:transmembrane emp24 domain-containing protein 10-like n=1 Tax=Heptranchias perlo TaxID=212740 RepID=UPI00355AAEC7
AAHSNGRWAWAGIRCPWKPRRNRATRERPQARLPVPGLRPDSQSPASGPSPTPSPRPQALPDSQSPASGPSPTPSPRPLPDSQSPASGPSPTPSPRPQAPPRLPVPGLRPSPPPPALLLPLAALNQLLAAGAISFQLPSNARKCLREEIHKDRLVTDSSGHILYSKEEATKGKFAFTTDDYDMFEICFESRLPPGHFRVPDQLIILNTKHGVEAKNYEDIAKAEKLKPLEVELRRLEDLSESIVNDFADMKQREEEMRDTNGEDLQRETQTKDHVKI